MRISIGYYPKINLERGYPIDIIQKLLKQKISKGYYPEIDMKIRIFNGYNV